MPHTAPGVLLMLLVIVATACVPTTSRTATETRPRPDPTPARFKAIDEQTLADQPLELQTRFRAAHGERADEEWNAIHNRELLQSMAERATLVASPNPVATREWVGTTTITFDAGGGSVVGQVYVSVNGGPERRFATASGGSQDADWISRWSTYEFRLYGGSNREQLLRSVSVTRANDVVTPWSVGPAPALGSLALLVAGVVAGRTARPRAGWWLKAAFAVTTTGLVLWPVVSTPPRPLDQQPFPDSHEYADAARHLAAGDGYVTTVHEDTARPPRYPPGFALVLAPVLALGGSYPASILGTTPWLGALYLVAAAATAWLIGGPLAAGLAAALVGTAPFAIEAASLVMADALVAAATVLLAGLLQRRAFGPAAVLSGALTLIRLSAVVAVPSLLLSIPPTIRWRMALLVLPGIVALGVYQWATFGSPLASGYDYWLPGLRMFDPTYALQRPTGDLPTLVGDMFNGELLGWMCPCPDEGGPLTRLPNVLFYPAVIYGPFWIFAPPLIGLLGFVYAALHVREPAARFTVVLTITTCLLLMMYVFQAARLVAAPAVLGAIYAAVAAARFLDR